MAKKKAKSKIERMIKIYHNPRCSKSRLGVEVLKKSGKDFEIIKYLDNRFTEATLTAVIKLLKIAPIDLVRKNEKIWKETFKGKELLDTAIITAMTENPKLIERPIVVNGQNAVIGRPTSNISTIV